jgi:hypothetical protein
MKFAALIRRHTSQITTRALCVVILAAMPGYAFAAEHADIFSQQLIRVEMQVHQNVNSVRRSARFPQVALRNMVLRATVSNVAAGLCFARAQRAVALVINSKFLQ